MANPGSLERAIADVLWDAGTDRLPVPARFARSVEDEPARGTGQRRSTT